MPYKFFLLPGLDGTGKLFEGFGDAIESSNTTILSLPTNAEQNYDSLVGELSPAVAKSSNAVLIAESFSGPIAVKIAARHPGSVTAIILVASFVTPPVPMVARLVPWSIVFRLPVPAFAARWLMVGATATDELVQTLKSSVSEVPAMILAQRIRELTSLDARKELSVVQCPALYLRPTADKLVPARCVRVLREAKADIEFREIDGPHLILQREPVNAWRAISNFLDGIATTERID